MEIDIKVMVENFIENEIRYKNEYINNCAYGKRELYEIIELENILEDKKRVEEIAEDVYYDSELTDKINDLIDYYLHH